ncbi:integrase catalytic domain-containing protein [Trichonephila clavipes]|nr:integrase catalytic domain-containing protein [Trichonephila clavipes]
METIEKIRAKRKTVRSASTKAPNNKEVEDLLSDKELFEAEIEGSLEYEENINEVRYKIKSKISKIHLSQPVVNSKGANESNVRTNNSAFSLNLPKLRIPNFSGDSSTYLEFINSFTNAIDAKESLSNVDKFIYLKSFLSGEASKIVSGFALTEDNYKSCLNLLKDRYGRQNHLISCYMNKLLEIEPVKSSFNLKGLRKLHDESEINIRNLDSIYMGIASGNYGHLLIPIMLKQLPHDLVVEFHRQKDSKDIGDVRELMRFIKFEIESRESANIALGHSQKIPENSRYPPRNLSYQRQQPKFKNNIPSSSALTTVIKNVCIFCNSDTHT